MSKNLIVAGSRGFDDYGLLEKHLGEFSFDGIISGGAKGADALGERYAIHHCKTLSVFPADWDKHGKKAGFLRNIEMSRSGDIAIVFWDGQSKGSKHMIQTMQTAGKPCFVVFNPKDMRKP